MARRTRTPHVFAIRRVVVVVRRIIVRGYNSSYWYGGSSYADTGRCRGTTSCRRSTAVRRRGIQIAVAVRRPVVRGYRPSYRYNELSSLRTAIAGTSGDPQESYRM